MTNGTGWSLRAWRREGLLMIQADGPASAESLRTLRAFIVAAMQTHGDMAVVVDLREAWPEMNAAGWQAAASDAAKAGLGTPIAMVVSPEHLEATLQHCFAVAAHGLRRMVFTRVDRAVSWARETAGCLPDVQAPRLSPSQPSPRLRLVPSDPR